MTLGVTFREVRLRTGDPPFRSALRRSNPTDSFFQGYRLQLV